MNGNFYYFHLKPFMDVPEAIDIIKNAGGYAILAHPGRLCCESGNLYDLIESLIPLGLEGIECYP